MIARTALLLATVMFASSACTSEDSPSAAETDPPVGGGGAGGSGGSGGSAPSGCPAGTTTQDDGSCVPAGVPEDGCGDGFEYADGGCSAILPSEPCGAGLIAVPGDTECREIAPCGQGTWGDIPTEPNTQFVDVAYPGVDNDGSEARPWSTVQDGIDAAEAGAVVAIAAGAYLGRVFIIDKSVRIYGRCPAMVELSTDTVGDRTVWIDVDAGGTEVRGLAVTSTELGIHVQGAADVVLEDLWLHDIDDWAMYVDSFSGNASVTVRNVLVERAMDAAITVLSAEVIAEGVAVRDTRRTIGFSAAGVTVQDAGLETRGRLTVRQSLITRTNGTGAYVGGADLTFERTAIIDSRTAIGFPFSGLGVSLQDSPDDPEAGTLTMRQTVVETSRTLGIYVSGGDATLDNCTIRDVKPDQSTGRLGHGIGIEDHIVTARPSTVQIDRCLIDQTSEVGVSIYGSNVTISASRVRATEVNAKLGRFGRGVSIQGGAQDSALRSSVHIDDSAIENNNEAGVLVMGSDLWMDHTAVTDTLPLPAHGLGDNVIVFGRGETNAEMTNCHIARSARAGVAVFGGNLALGGNRLECNPIAIGTEVYEGVEPILVDDGGNTCACDGVEGTCRAQQSSLEPPEAL